MNCKFCNAEVGEEHKFCPYCGKTLSDDVAPADEVIGQETVVTEQQPKKKKWPLVLGIVGGVAALSALAIVLMIALGVDFKWLLPRANDIFVKEAYTVSDEKALDSCDTVVATINGKELTNTQLQIFYRMQVMDFLSYYGDYVSYVGMDYTKPLSEQICYYDDTKTWEQYFLDISIDTWQNYQTLALLAEEAGHVLSEEAQKSLDELPANLQQQATEGKYESVDALLQDVIGPGCTQETYLEYVRLVFLSNDYYGAEYERLTPNDADVEAYFTEHADTFAEQGITKESGLISAVRHILIAPEGGKKDEESGVTIYSEDEWAACLAKAEKLVEDWKAGEATEESFAALVKDNTADTGSASTGGLYEGIYKDSGMVEPFETWSIDMTRKPGDVGIVKADFDHYKGYHIIYFVSGEPYWQDAARTQLLSERTTAMIDEAEAKWPMEVNYRKIAISELKFA